MEWVTVSLPDGRALEAVVHGPEGGLGFLFHPGTPSAADAYPPSLEAAAERGLRFVSISRPGYAGSSPAPGRSVGAVAADAAAVLDRLGVERFVTAGFSGGGPYALACAALLTERCAAAATAGGGCPLSGRRAGLDRRHGRGQHRGVRPGASR